MRIISKDSKELNSIPIYTKNYYKTIIKYLDEHLYYNYLKLTDPLYGLTFESQTIYYLKADVGVSIPHILYIRFFPDDDEKPHPFIIDAIKLNIENNIYTLTQNLIDLKTSLNI